jgi:hypothetical protein
MRPLWPLERAALLEFAGLHPAAADALRQQIATVRVTSFENTGVGFFSSLTVDSAAPVILHGSPLGEVHGEVLGVPHGMGFLLFLKDGRATLLEGFSYAGSSTESIDFERAIYALTPGLRHPGATLEGS